MDDVLKVVCALVAVLITRYALPALKSYIESNNIAKLYSDINTLVYAAEQLIKGSGRGDDKLSYVLERLEASGYEITQDVKLKIESTVKKMNGGG